jgi:DNA polymerase III epsilon subunit-like protein
VPDVPEAFISVDIETAGPVPSAHALLSVGACLIEDPARSFYAELQPTTREAVPAALAVSGLSLDQLAASGLPPAEAMARFAAWVEEVAGGRRPVFAAFNAPFDWMFVADYFHRCGVPNPFGHSALDLKSLYMGVAGGPWSGTSFAAVAARFGLPAELPHHALEDARLQAEVFRRLVAGTDPRPHPSDKERTP